MTRILILFSLLTLWVACKEQDPHPSMLLLESAEMGGTPLALSPPFSSGLSPDRSLVLTFSQLVDPATLAVGITLWQGANPVSFLSTVTGNGRTVILSPSGLLLSGATYRLVITDSLRGSRGEAFAPFEFQFTIAQQELALVAWEWEGARTIPGLRVIDVAPDLKVKLVFSAPVDEALARSSIRLTGPQVPALQLSFGQGGREVTVSTTTSLRHLTRFEIHVANTLKSQTGSSFSGANRVFFTRPDAVPRMPVVSDEALLDLVQRQTFRYFWDFAHPASGMARERNTSGDLVTVGGSGFGVMALVVGMEKGWISRQEGVARLRTIVDFLAAADRFHGAWPHWLNGNTGQTIAFSAFDDGADLVETALMIQGLLTAKQYLQPGVPEEKYIIDLTDRLWREVEWDWFTRGGSNVLYWHWSPNHGWAMNLRITGWNESLIVYVLAASSPTYPISPEVYHQGWSRNSQMVNGRTFYGITLPLGPDRGGPLFFSHYSFLGLDPRNLVDTYASYWQQNRSHTLINRAYCVENPLGFAGYGPTNWGLTASDNHLGYAAHSPGNDLGVISPTAALSSFPFTPEESMEALRFFYYTLGDQLWGPYGFYDAFNITEQWFATSYLAIDQGPIVLMIENYRSALLWNLFMAEPAMQQGLNRLGFTY
jgi:hypothetical protein